PGLNGIERLAEKIGLQAAMDYVLTGKNMRPAKARSLGIADDVVPPAILEDVAAAFALKLAEAGPPFTRRPPKKGKNLNAALRHGAPADVLRRGRTGVRR